MSALFALGRTILCPRARSAAPHHPLCSTLVLALALACDRALRRRSSSAHSRRHSSPAGAC
eukprot:9909433-Heterocapsa_arctica.AAC.1